MGSVPQDGAAGRARAGLVIPGIGGVRALSLGRSAAQRRLRSTGSGSGAAFGSRLSAPAASGARLPALPARAPARRVRRLRAPRSGRADSGSARPLRARAASSGSRAASRARARERGSGAGGGSRARWPRVAPGPAPAGLGHRALGVVPQSRLNDLQAPLGVGPPGELGPRQHLRPSARRRPRRASARWRPIPTRSAQDVPCAQSTQNGRAHGASERSLPEMKPGRHGFLRVGLLS